MQAPSDEIDVSETPQESIPTKHMLSWARNSTIYRLERKMMTERQLFDAIAKKARTKFEGISAEQVQAVADSAVKFAYEIKALDDKNFAEMTTRSAVRNGKSKRIIAQKLSTKGVDKETALAALDETNDLYAAIVLARKRRFGPFRREEANEKRKAKELSAFARGGFSFELCKRVFDMSEEEAEEILYDGA
jgi:regulatory protein